MGCEGVIMSAEKLNLVEWQTRYAAEEACEQALAVGFVCQKCGHDETLASPISRLNSLRMVHRHIDLREAYQ